MIHKAKKSLGQNFLKSNSALKTMCTASELNKNDTVLEIGPGKGALTAKLMDSGAKIIAIEKDFELELHLKEKFANEIRSGQLILINGDILDLEPNDFNKYNLQNGKYKIIANIPYNITGLIFKKFLSSVYQPSIMTLLVQREVAKRIVGVNSKSNSSKEKKESILSLSVKAYGDPYYIMKVSRRFFSPSPKVDSAILSIKNISRRNFKSKLYEDKFFEILKSGFAHKRKLLIRNLSGTNMLYAKNKNISKIFKKLKLNPKIRAEDVPLDIWFKLTSLL